MKQRVFKKLFCFLLVLVLVCGHTFAEDKQSIFQQKMEKAFRDYKAVGGSFVVYYKGERLVHYDYGFADKRNGIRVSENTKFKIASITKMVSAVGFMQLVEKGLVDLDQDISDILGYSVRNPYYKNTVITPRMLLCHTSSLQDSARSAHKRGSVSQMIGPNRVNDNAFAQSKPGTRYNYTNFGFGLIGTILEKVTGQTLQDYMAENVFLPLDIDAGYSFAELRDKEIAARYYNGNEVESVKSLQNQALNDEVDWENNYNVSVGKLLISAEDLSKILQVLCGNGYYKGKTILSRQSVEEMRKIPGVKQFITANTPYAIGIEKKTGIIENIALYGHQGLYYSAYCDAFYDPDNLVTMVLLTNGVNIVRIDGTNALARQLFMLCYKYLIEVPQDQFLVND